LLLLLLKKKVKLLPLACMSPLLCLLPCLECTITLKRRKRTT
jgi:hypothetical protein